MSGETGSKTQPWKAALAEQDSSNGSSKAAATDGKTGGGEFGAADKCVGTSSYNEHEENLFDSNKAAATDTKAGAGEFGPSDKCVGTSSYNEHEENLYDTNKAAATDGQS
ncbi:hypothetical protein MMC11_001174 [Xylographa trunciseda]|nr:hypothetical protein [Xylographa trunciseda]